MGEFRFRPKFPRRSEENVHSIFTLPRSSLTLWSSSPSATAVLFFTVLSAVCSPASKIKQQIHYWMWTFILCSFQTLDCLCLSSVKERQHIQTFRWPLHFLLKIVNAFNFPLEKHHAQFAILLFIFNEWLNQGQRSCSFSWVAAEVVTEMLLIPVGLYVISLLAKFAFFLARSLTHTLQSITVKCLITDVAIKLKNSVSLF